ncbi:hypothetical protein KCH_39720 [Kitasatospora cheerisanensis KCTC 2395]|uniref:Uncharacterized protein n=1 Tax=Kitasatospora cheerisanensis KCTC 2395 TaxID=1348663 RepID=A0A066Z1K0_9ACTN|nr:hypothetical protein KCH_39720 [Kitasatospora cheerisanensis KCTC 2395]
MVPVPLQAGRAPRVDRRPTGQAEHEHNTDQGGSIGLADGSGGPR